MFNREIKYNLTSSIKLKFSFHAGRRLHDFNVGLSSFVPWNGSPLDPTSYPLCAKYVGEVSSGATVELHCISMIFATALIVQIPGNMHLIVTSQLVLPYGLPFFIDEFVAHTCCVSTISQDATSKGGRVSNLHENEEN